MADQSKCWLLADYYEPVGEEEDENFPGVEGEVEFPEYEIYSESELSQRMISWIVGPSRIVELYSPQKDFLRIGIGGEFAGVAYIHLPNVHILLNADPEAPSSAEFEIQGQPSTLEADELHRPAVIIDLACYFYTHGRMPGELRWRVLDRCRAW
jgi:hypothetical protein